MASLSGLIKNISSIGGGTPADDDYFIFGKSNLKKVSWGSIKSLVTSKTMQAIETTLGVNVNLHKRCGVVFFRFGGYITKSLGTDYEQVCVIPEGYRPAATVTLTFITSVVDTAGIYVQISTDGTVSMCGSKTFNSGTGLNAMTTYVT